MYKVSAALSEGNALYGALFILNFCVGVLVVSGRLAVHAFSFLVFACPL